MALLVALCDRWGTPENSRFLLLSQESLPLIPAVPRDRRFVFRDVSSGERRWDIGTKGTLTGKAYTRTVSSGVGCY